LAQSRESKEKAFSELKELLSQSKLTVVAKYTGIDVIRLQGLKKSAKESDTVVRVAKNRLVRIAAAEVAALKDADLTSLKGQLLYAFNSDDEVAPAQALNAFAKNNPELEFVGAISATGEVYSAEQVKALADLPTKDQLRGQLVGVLAGPLSGFANVLSGNLRGLVNVLNARQSEMETN
jgi:large subunit ribosomal protein L10